MRNLHRQSPLISVVMPVFNGQKYLVDALASVIEQTFGDWELICVDDGSTDRSPAILEWFCRQDDRIRVLRQANSGIVKALNAGCDAARGPLLARMDCDDICLANRFDLQADFLRRHPKCSVVGGAILEIDQDGDPLAVARLPSEHGEIVDNLLHRKAGHFHPSTMIRSEALRAVGGYRTQYQWVEDHDLWLRLSQRGELANLPEPILCYRQHASSVCWQRSAEQRKLMNDLMREAYSVRGLELPPAVLHTENSHRATAGPGKWARLAVRGGYAKSSLKHLRRLLGSNASTGYKLRMLGEVGLRLPFGIATGLNSGTSTRRPNFPKWHTRFAQRQFDVRL